MKKILNQITNYFWRDTTIGNIISAHKKCGILFHIKNIRKNGRWTWWYSDVSIWGFYYDWYDGPYYSICFGKWKLIWESDWETYIHYPIRMLKVLWACKIITANMYDNTSNALRIQHYDIIRKFKAK